MKKTPDTDIIQFENPSDVAMALIRGDISADNFERAVTTVFNDAQIEQICYMLPEINRNSLVFKGDELSPITHILPQKFVHETIRDRIVKKGSHIIYLIHQAMDEMSEDWTEQDFNDLVDTYSMPAIAYALIDEDGAEFIDVDSDENIHPVRISQIAQISEDFDLDTKEELPYKITNSLTIPLGPAGRKFISNLEHVNPEIYDKLIDYINTIGRSDEPTKNITSEDEAMDAISEKAEISKKEIKDDQILRNEALKQLPPADREKWDKIMTELDAKEAENEKEQEKTKEVISEKIEEENLAVTIPEEEKDEDEENLDYGI